ncbi:hypothetical protein SDRG_04810 [Saprolegnia diclina VS20]|uniref:Fatty acid hydroxylase domain-containing protein n=1 Tax=Saprolegnia diclina (strain VS20) TaxID=1156394 RepID=T0QIE6_SAPDV|nr:hypothetical protein SDRG_04810 [Saprolegnia diclina VS20]EQC37784.1 hypothetical protein SDRG_04810 [Saprolegnia diclina VS20]|eukprot:XP_008608717.1 hypothetical protein SDRG_04810 [Saprolegnia diclina VS20]
MAPFDAVVRGPKAPAPLARLHGLPYFVIAQIIFATNVFVLINWYGAIGALAGLGLGVLGSVLDALVSNSFGRNVLVLRYNGFSDWSVLCAMALALLGGQLMNVIVIEHLAGPAAVADLLAASSYTPWTLVGVLVNIGMSEVLFYKGHQFLHEMCPELHLMHHCCLRPTGSSNLISDPRDLAIELGGPGAILIMNHFLLWDEDATVLLLSYLFVTWYYTITHHEWLATYHIKHHTRLDAVYTVYINQRGDARLDKIKNLLKRPPKHVLQ